MTALRLQNTSWSDEHKIKLRAVWNNADLSPEAVEVEMQRSWQSCRVMAGFMRLGRRPPGVPTEKNAFWTKERIAILTAGVAGGKTFAEIALEIGGCSRMACIGKASRLGLQQPTAASPPKRLARTAAAVAAASARRAAIRAGQPTPPPKPRLVVCGNNTVIQHPERPPRAPAPKALAWVALEGSTPRPFETRRFIECNWPIDDENGAPMLRCCLPVERGGYCWDHATRAFTAPKAPGPRATRELLRANRRFYA